MIIISYQNQNFNSWNVSLISSNLMEDCLIFSKSSHLKWRRKKKSLRIKFTHLQDKNKLLKKNAKSNIFVITNSSKNMKLFWNQRTCSTQKSNELLFLTFISKNISNSLMNSATLTCLHPSYNCLNPPKLHFNQKHERKDVAFAIISSMSYFLKDMK